jgi:hypothetical protein
MNRRRTTVEVVHQFSAGKKMFQNIPLCNHGKRRGLVGQWNPEGVTCKRCKKIAKGKVVAL